MAADAERRRLACQSDGFVSGWCCGHERGACQTACMGQFHDGAVDAGREAEVVGIHNQLLHEAECIKRLQKLSAANINGAIFLPSQATLQFWV